MIKPLIVIGSARKKSDTKCFVEKVFTGFDITIIDLLDFNILPFDYSNTYNEADDFNEIVDYMLQHDIIVFATPVYWYAMSGSLKTFFDRFTDLTIAKKELGRKLKGKNSFLLAVGADEALPEGFEVSLPPRI